MVLKYKGINKNCLVCGSSFYCYPFEFETRKYWISFFQKLLNEKYNYQYHDEKILMEIQNENVKK